MRVIFCSSYISVPATLTLVDEALNDYLVITENKMLSHFLGTILPLENVFYLSPKPLSLKSPFKLLGDLLFNRDYKKKVLNRLSFKNIDVYFFAVASCDFSFWLVKKLSKKNKIYYKPAVSISHLKNDYSFKAQCGRLFRILIYSINFTPVKGLDATWFKINDNFLNNIGAINCELPVNVKKTASQIYDSFSEVRQGIVLMLCGDIANVYVDELEYRKLIDKLILSLYSQFSKDKLRIKAHPVCPRYISREDELIKIPSYLPANMIVDFFKVVIGYSSATLIEAALSGKVAISTLKLMKPLHDETFQNCYDYLNNNSNSQVHFPKTVDEVLNILQKGCLV